METPKDNPRPQQDANVIPDGVSAVRFILAHESGRKHLSYRTFEEALADPDAALVFEADSGGQILLSCPARHVRADPATLRRLLAGLDTIAWGPGFDPAAEAPDDSADLFFEHLPAGSTIAGGMGGGRVVDGVWLHHELEELGLRPRVEAILAGRSTRLDLPPDFPDVELASLAEARQYPLGRVYLFSTLRGHMLVNCLAPTVRVDESRLLRLIEQLDAVLEGAHPLFTNVRRRVPPRLRFYPAQVDFERRGGHYVNTPLILGTDYNGRPIEPLERNRDAIAAILTGGEWPLY